jgi:hypothetical protein
LTPYEQAMQDACKAQMQQGAGIGSDQIETWLSGWEGSRIICSYYGPR